jgi:hexokinase
MHYSSIDIEKEVKTFIKEIEKGLCGDDSTLKMLYTYINHEGEIPANELVIVMNAGGTNFRVAVVTFHSAGKFRIDDFKLYPMPDTDREISKKDFSMQLRSVLSQL